MTSFIDLGVPADLANVLAADGKTEAFPIQTATLPDSLAGRDVLGRGRTGSGKTIAFALPLVARLAESGRRTKSRQPRGLVLAPTRELATQIAATIQPLAKAAGLTVTTIFGGISQNPQVRDLNAGVDIVVACPGRLEDLMKQNAANLGSVEVTVLDEADHMADLGFLPGVTRIMAATPTSGQRLLFSATLDNGIDKLVSKFLSNPASHEADPGSVPQGEMTHRLFTVSTADGKRSLVKALASGTGRRIMFTRTKHQAKKLARQLTADGIPAFDLQGNLSQNARERNLGAFAAEPGTPGAVRVLVATDVAARGVHVDDVELVVHVDPPVEHKSYLHRSGRTARAGASGVVVTVVLPEQRRDVSQLLKLAKITAEFEDVTASSEAVAALVGEVAEYVKPAPIAAPAAGGRSASAAGRGGSSRSGGADTTPRSGGRRRRSGSSAQPAKQGQARSASASSRTSSSSRTASSASRSGARSAAAPARSGGGMTHQPFGSGAPRSSGGNRRVQRAQSR